MCSSLLMASFVWQMCSIIFFPFCIFMVLWMKLRNLKWNCQNETPPTQWIEASKGKQIEEVLFWLGSASSVMQKKISHFLHCAIWYSEHSPTNNHSLALPFWNIVSLVSVFQVWAKIYMQTYLKEKLRRKSVPVMISCDIAK